MYNIALIFPLKFKKFYINPFYLQKIYAIIAQEHFMQYVCTQLLDVNTEHYYQKLHTKHFELAIIDTPEGEIDSLKKALDTVNADNVLLVGDTIKYGKSENLLKELNKLYSYTLYGCLDDSVILDFIKINLFNGQMDEISGLMYFERGKFVQNEIYKRHKYNENEKIQLYFTDEIIQAYEEKGIQIFMDGLSRGCENKCSFCKLNNNLSLKNKVSQSQIDVIKTIDYLSRECKKKLFIQFTDENFFGGGIYRLNQIIELSHELLKIKFDGALGVDTRLDTVYNPNNYNIHDNEIRKEAWYNLCNTGLRYCFLGLETFSKSQAIRYNKNLNLSNFKYTISFFKDRGIIYTIGLILWDPLMKKSELMENLDFIKSNCLLGNTASLLKTMRIQLNSQYSKKYEKLTVSKFSDYFNIDDEFIEYKDPEIRKILPFVKIIYNIFNNNGYRHSDVALFSVLYNENTPKIFKKIPYEISKMEYDILIYLLQLGNVLEWRDTLKAIFMRCHSTVAKIISTLKQTEKTCNDLKAIKNYYDDVFSKIYINLTNEMKILTDCNDDSNLPISL